MSDLIYRQAAIEALEAKKDKSAKGDIGCFYNTIIQNDIDTLKGLPSAQPKGHWIGSYCPYRCSECGKTNESKDNFCWNCGSDMRERVTLNELSQKLWERCYK